jgi:flagellar assembly protein FliH
MLSKRLPADAKSCTIAWPSVQDAAEAERTPEQEAGAEAGDERESVQQALDQVRREARQAGETAVRRQLEPQLKAAEERLARAVADIAVCKQRLRAETEREMVELALTIARKVVRRELTVDPAAITGIARAALDRVSARDIVRVRVSPSYCDALRKAVADIGPGAAIDIEADPALGAGGLVIETNRGALDASVDGQLDEIEHGLADRLEGGR